MDTDAHGSELTEAGIESAFEVANVFWGVKVYDHHPDLLHDRAVDAVAIVTGTDQQVVMDDAYEMLRAVKLVGTESTYGSCP